jgi:hypothetical protein
MARTYSIPSVDTALVGVLNQGKSFILVENPVLPVLGAVGHGTQDDLGDLETRVSESKQSAQSSISYYRGIAYRVNSISLAMIRDASVGPVSN